MCTVTYFPKANGDFILTSNRDEAPQRSAIPPKVQHSENVQLVYPEDALSGGSWIGVSDKSRAICLLNGAQEIHERQSTYRKSRGVVVKEFLKVSDLHQTALVYDFYDIEPFTMIVISWERTLEAFELIWNGTERTIKMLGEQPMIWSSSTLYDQRMKQQRQHWFADFLESGDWNESNVLEFHKKAGVGDQEVDVIMDRGFVKTTSITQIVRQTDAVHMRFESLEAQKTHTVTLAMQNA